jgi:hypothetical protein
MASERELSLSASQSATTAAGAPIDCTGTLAKPRLLSVNCARNRGCLSAHWQQSGLKKTLGRSCWFLLLMVGPVPGAFPLDPHYPYSVIGEHFPM